MTRTIDLSHAIHEGMLTFPVHWHPVVEITQLGRHGVENRETRKLVFGSHCGTHVDAPRHFIPGGKTIEAIDLDLLVGPARLLDFTPAAPKQEFGVEDFKKRLGDEKPRRVILRFDWSDRWNTMAFYTDQPFVTEEAAQWLVDRGVRLVAMDTPQMDNPINGRTGPKDSPIHKIMLGAEAVFVECCTNLRELTGPEVDLVVLPLKILGSDGAPCRVIARQP